MTCSIKKTRKRLAGNWPNRVWRTMRCGGFFAVVPLAFGLMVSPVLAQDPADDAAVEDATEVDSFEELLGETAPAVSNESNAKILPGSIAVTGFSGTTFPHGGLKPGVDPIDETFIDLSGKSLRIFDVDATGEKAKGQLVYTPPPFTVEARKIGQVFGLAYDDGKDADGNAVPPNLYAGATSLLGVQVVIPDADDDGRPERIKTGEESAVFMDGQHGLELDGGPGSIYKIDGQTGEITLFADVRLGGIDNSGPGLGNIAFDRANRQLFVSDMDTGMIHRFGLDGIDGGHFDHGIDGRGSAGLDEVPDDSASRMSITTADFDAQDPETWGYTAPERRIHGLAVKGRRLYYAVFDGLQIWSVGINRDGSFGDDARKEIDVKSDTEHPITDMVFDRHGYLYLAQRGHVKNAYDYATFAVPEKSQVLRYQLEVPDDPETESVWVETPAEYAVGFHNDHRMAVGGIDVGYGYDKDGNINANSCGGTLGKTGDDLRHNEELKDKLAEGGPFHVHGFQLTDKTLVRPKNTPPWSSFFVDYDDLFEDPEVRGHIGDIEMWNPCEGRVGWGETVPCPGGPPTLVPPSCDGDCPPPVVPKCVELEWAEFVCNPGGYDGYVWLTDKSGIGADSVKVQSLNPGIVVSPGMQTLGDPADPFVLDIAGALPGDKVNVNICFYKGSDAVPGKPFPCCQAQIPLTMPSELCAP